MPVILVHRADGHGRSSLIGRLRARATQEYGPSRTQERPGGAGTPRAMAHQEAT
jgi:hypothetical protein